jgi:hypothetical protein
MARIRKGKAAETKARLEALEEKKAEEPNKQLCCNVNPLRECSRCPTKYCEEHLKKAFDEDQIYYVHGKFLCYRCLSIEILFGDVNAK